MKRFAILAALPLALAASCVDTSPQPSNFRVGNHVDDWRDEIIYQVLVDRFADADQSNDYRVDPTSAARYHGGDWRGLANRLAYIQALGVTTLWISPIVKNVETDAGIDSYHGYWQQDPFSLNPHFGNLDDLRDLIGRAHAVGIKVILDVVTNHMGQMFYYDINMNGRPDENVQGGIDPSTGRQSATIHITEYDPDYEDPVVMSWTSLGIAGPAPVIFLNDPTINRVPPPDARLADPANYHRRGRIVNYDQPCNPAVPITCPDGMEQTMFGDFPGGLKDLATENQAVRDAMAEAFSKWIELADFDGFRIDTVKHVEHGFWQDFGNRIRSKAASLGKDKFLMFGEVFDGRDDLVGSYTHNRELDGLFDFPQYFQVFRDVFIDGAPTTHVENRWKERATNWSNDAGDGGLGIAPVNLHVNFLDNHDVGRYLWQAQARDDKLAVLKNALVFLLTEDGIPCIYYGTEQGFSGGNDPANREDLSTSDYAVDGDLFRFIAHLTRVRKASKALTRGTLTFAWTSALTWSPTASDTDKAACAAGTDCGVIAFERKTDAGDYALVVINTNPKQKGATNSAGKAMAVHAPAGTVLVDQLAASGGRAFPVGADGTLNVQLDPDDAVVLVPQ
jgi:glycosidase